MTALEGGGLLAVLDCLRAVTTAEEDDFFSRWNDESDSDPELAAARNAVHVLDSECRESIPFWLRIDFGDHVMRAADGHLQLIDLVGLTGEPMTETDLHRHRRVLRHHPARGMPLHARDSVL